MGQPSTSHCAATVSLLGQRVDLHVSGAVFIADLDTLIVADLHFEKGSSFARRGQLLPPFDTAATLSALEQVIWLYGPQRVISLGDAFHDREAEQRLSPADAERLEALCTAHDWNWVTGNHDPRPPLRFSGKAHRVMELGGLVLVHEPGDHQDWSLAGHLHPCAVVEGKGCRVRRPCYISDAARMVLPAFGAYTGGLNVLDEAFAPHFSDPSFHVAGQHRTYQVPSGSLRPDPTDRHALRNSR
ncbi:MAG: ligase-associated DNA damage response endonuclease PdeM [Parvularcula sp.]